MPFPPRRVLLAVKGEHLEQRLFASASNLAKRMSAGLEILMQADKEDLPEPLPELLRQVEAEAVPYRIGYQATLSAREVVRYANTHECVACVVIDAPENWGGQAGVWEKLACPLVVAAQKPTAAQD